MNRQGPGKIEWTDYTWSPVTGCKHGCSYCYANRIAQRIYLEKFEPTFRPERLKEPSKLKTPSKIFVCDMADLFGDWVDEEWIEAVMASINKAPWHIYQFLTKNPARYSGWSFGNNCWLGTTIDRPEVQHERWNAMAAAKAKVKFISFEPLLGPMRVEELGMSALDWIIIGELTGKAMTQEEIHQVRVWAEEIIDQAKELNIPVFVKNALGAIFPQREFPKVR